MTVDINTYLAKSYPSPPCWSLVADLFASELSLPVTEYKTINSDIRSIASAFRLALSKSAHGFEKITDPRDFAVVLLSRLPKLGWHHCGVIIEGRVLHAVESGVGGVKYEDLSTVLDTYPTFQYWART